MKRFILAKLNKYLRVISRRERNEGVMTDTGQQRATVIKADSQANSEIEKTSILPRSIFKILKRIQLAFNPNSEKNVVIKFHVFL